MPPKAQKKPTKAAKAKDDEDMAFLNQQQKATSIVNEKLKKENDATAKKDAAKKAADKRQATAAAAEHRRAMLAMPPVMVEDIALAVAEMKGATKDGNQMRDMCWLSYCINNFFSYVIESGRRLHVKTPAAPGGEGEPVVSYTVYDIREEENCPHSWNTVTAASGPMCFDVALRQFLPTGRHGFLRDARPEEGWIPMAGMSRLRALGAADDDPTLHTGVPAKDGGVLPLDGITVVAKGIPEGATKKYLQFLTDAQSNRHAKMNPAEMKTARILYNQKSASAFADIHERLAYKFFESNKAA